MKLYFEGETPLLLFLGNSPLSGNEAYVEFKSETDTAVFGKFDSGNDLFFPLGDKPLRAFGGTLYLLGPSCRLIEFSDPPDNKPFEIARQGEVVLSGEKHGYTFFVGNGSRTVFDSDKAFATFEYPESLNLEKIYALSNHLVLVFDKRVQAVYFDGDYKNVFSKRYDNIDLKKDGITLSRALHTQEGIVETVSYAFSAKKLSERYNTTLEGNYTDELLPLAFLERLRYLPGTEAEKLISDKALRSLSAFCKLFGGFTKIKKFDKFYYLCYPYAKNVYVCRRFDFEVADGLILNAREI